MLTAVRDGCKITLNEQQEEVRSMVLAGLEQVKAGNTKDFNEVCDRLEKKYQDAAIQS